MTSLSASSASLRLCVQRNEPSGPAGGGGILETQRRRGAEDAEGGGLFALAPALHENPGKNESVLAGVGESLREFPAPAPGRQPLEIGSGGSRFASPPAIFRGASGSGFALSCRPCGWRRLAILYAVSVLA